MMNEVVITGILYGKSKSGNPYRLLFLEDADAVSTEKFEGKRTYTAFAPSNCSYVVGDLIQIIVHKGEAIIIA